MGATLSSRRNTGVESVDIAASNAYRYPPKTGQYFGTHFIMGGERFDSPQPGEYLFGENEDLNFLGNKPVPFPYPVPSGNEPTKTLKSLVYIRKDTLRLIRSPVFEKVPLEQEKASTQYTLEFTFDSDCRCAITVFYLATEEISGGHISYHPKDPALSSQTYHYKKGAGQIFSQADHIIDPSKFSDEEWVFGVDKDAIPVVIQCTVEEEEHMGHSHITYAMLEKGGEGGYNIKPLKQKQFVDGLSYLLQEIYGIENKNMERSKLDPEDDLEDSGAECVICMSDMRDTLILPCRHLCLCSACAESLRYQASMCPICRVKFRALLQVRAMRKKAPVLHHQGEPDENPVSQEGVPPGYEAVTLIEALNGQCAPLPGEGGPPLHMVPPVNTVYTMDSSKKIQKGSQITEMTPIEYQKEMDPDKEVGDINEKQPPAKKEEEEEEGQKGRVTPEVVMSDNNLETDKKRGSPKKPPLPDVRYYPSNKRLDNQVKEPAYPREMVAGDKQARKSPPSYEECRLESEKKVQTAALYKLSTLECEGGKLASGISTGHIADDEQEDTSEGEPEPDYEEEELEEDEEDEEDEDDDEDTTTGECMTESEESEIRGVSLFHPAGSLEESEYQAMQPVDQLATHGGGGGSSGTEGSSYGSNSSSQALLTNVGATEEDKTSV
ncbi:E3 ubiquitin-protein ligase MGRN1-like [Haliotis rufescens]|uniref:E3 ubiquitin-protein ligase MGRN1-like n=1 Tax=Haliotis rufescens TaxID=6454 RepID=UPI00201F3442|nr:E3 ubiquitin-protein ligase MGRN1-like [Haliotis rufescens]